MMNYYVDTAVGNDGNPGTSAGAGNAWQTIAHAVAIAVAGDVVNVKASGTYTFTSAVTLGASGTASAPITFAGYTTTPGDGGLVSLACATNSVDFFSLAGQSFVTFRNFHLTHTAGTPGRGFAALAGNATWITLENIIAEGCSYGFYGANLLGDEFACSPILLARFVAKNCVNQGVRVAGAAVLEYCDVRGSGSDGVYFGSFTGNSFRMVGSLVAGNGGSGVNIGSVSATGMFSLNLNRISENGGDGVTSVVPGTAALGLAIQNNIISGNAGKGLNFASQPASLTNHKNAYGGNGSANANVPAGLGDVALSADPFNNSTGGASADFGLNSTAGGGAACRAAGFPGAFASDSTSVGLDLGGGQHPDAGGGTYTAASNVRSGTDRGDGVTGTLVVPAAGTVLIGTTFDNGTAGTVTLPAAGDVESGVTFGAALGSTGTFAVPAVTNVKTGITYGAGGTEFTGTLSTSGLTLSDVRGELDARNLTASFTSGASGLVRANCCQFLGQPVVLDANNYPGVNLIDVNGTPASGGDSFDANLVSVNGNAFAGANVPALLSSYALGQDPATLVLDATASVHNAAGTLGAMLNATAAPADPWARTLPSTYPAGTAGAILGANLDAKVSSRSTFAGGTVAGVTTPVTVNAINGQGPPANWSRLAIDPSSGGVTIGTNNDKTGYALATPAPTASQNAAAVALAILQTPANRIATDPSGRVSAGTVIDKSGYILAATGLDAVAVTDPGAPANHTTLPKMLVALWRRSFKKATLTATQLKTFADDGVTANSTQVVSDDGTAQTVNAAT